MLWLATRKELYGEQEFELQFLFQFVTFFFESIQQVYQTEKWWNLTLNMLYHVSQLWLGLGEAPEADM